MQVSTIAIAVAGIFSMAAVIVSRICEIISERKTPRTNHPKDGYECGFERNHLQGFTFVSEKKALISIYLILELAFIWILACVMINITAKDLRILYSLRVLIIVILLAITLTFKRIIYKGK